MPRRRVLVLFLKYATMPFDVSSGILQTSPTRIALLGANDSSVTITTVDETGTRCTEPAVSFWRANTPR